MKITDLELEQYGIYQNESWKPAAGCLNVIMGENESGKTTLLRFIRDMMFGYERGKWQGKKGNMGFLRADGSAYRIYRCLLYTSPSPRDGLLSRMPSSA